MKAPDSILIVDDEPNGFEVLEGILFQEGYQLDYVSNGVETFDFLETSLPDLILLDVMMPDIDGIEVCRRIKAKPEWSHIPIIMVTALNSKESLAECLCAGADDFIGKPVSPLEVRARIRSMLRIKHQHEQLEQARNQLESFLKLREDMADMIVHDLRNPLTTIMLGANLLKWFNLKDVPNRVVDDINYAAERLDSIIDSILMISKLESGKIVITKAKANIGNLIKKIVESFEFIAEQNEVNIVCELPPKDCLVNLDYPLMLRVLENLLNNAIKFAPQKSEVILRVKLSEESDQVYIQVIDSGQGVKEKLKQIIFQKHEIGQRFKNIKQTGIGLAFCKMAVEAHGGIIRVEDNYPQGAIFTIQLSCN